MPVCLASFMGNVSTETHGLKKDGCINIIRNQDIGKIYALIAQRRLAMLNDFGCGVCSGKGVIWESAADGESGKIACICPQCLGHGRVKLVTVAEECIIDLKPEQIEQLIDMHNGETFGEFTSDMLVKWMEMGEELYLPDSMFSLHLLPNVLTTDKKE